MGVNVFLPVEFTNAVLECYRQIEGVARYLRERIPGFEKARIEQIAPVLGVRETRHIVGEYSARNTRAATAGWREPIARGRAVYAGWVVPA